MSSSPRGYRGRGRGRGQTSFDGGKSHQRQRTQQIDVLIPIIPTDEFWDVFPPSFSLDQPQGRVTDAKVAYALCPAQSNTAVCDVWPGFLHITLAHVSYQASDAKHRQILDKIQRAMEAARPRVSRAVPDQPFYFSLRNLRRWPRRDLQAGHGKGSYYWTVDVKFEEDAVVPRLLATLDVIKETLEPLEVSFNMHGRKVLEGREQLELHVTLSKYDDLDKILTERYETQAAAMGALECRGLLAHGIQLACPGSCKPLSMGSYSPADAHGVEHPTRHSIFDAPFAPAP